MIETSKDLLFVVLALCILWLTIFLTWMLYYVIAIIRDAKNLIGLIKGIARKVDDLTNKVHEKLDRSSATFGIVARAVKEIVIWAIEERLADRSSQKKKTVRRKSSK